MLHCDTAGDVQDALHDVGDRLSASLRPRRDAPLFNFGIGASLGLSQGGVQPIVCPQASMDLHLLLRHGSSSCQAECGHIGAET